MSLLTGMRKEFNQKMSKIESMDEKSDTKCDKRSPHSRKLRNEAKEKGMREAVEKMLPLPGFKS